MLSLRAIGEAAICSLPDRLTGRVSAAAQVIGRFEISDRSASRAILVDVTEAPVFAVEITVGSI